MFFSLQSNHVKFDICLVKHDESYPSQALDVALDDEPIITGEKIVEQPAAIVKEDIFFVDNRCIVF